MGDYDAPAQVDYVRKATGFDKLTYIGHSQGTT
jgi:pimeloyl-ACP methyl ester carboxylesterase